MRAVRTAGTPAWSGGSSSRDSRSFLSPRRSIALQLPLARVPELDPSLIPAELHLQDADVVVDYVSARGRRKSPDLGANASKQLVLEGDHLPIDGDPVTSVLPVDGRRVLALQQALDLCHASYSSRPLD